MKIQHIAERALAVVWQSLGEAGEPECARLLVQDAVVVRHGNHFAIEPSEAGRAELESVAHRAEGRCGCGAPLSLRLERLVCRTCGCDYRWQ